MGTDLATAISTSPMSSTLPGRCLPSSIIISTGISAGSCRAVLGCRGSFRGSGFRSTAKRMTARRRPDSAEEQEIDRILEKIHREGESSLTRKERRLLETASREYQKRLRGE